MTSQHTLHKFDWEALDAWLANNPITPHQQVEVVAVHVSAALLREQQRRKKP
jgi:hypothetical protein